MDNIVEYFEFFGFVKDDHGQFVAVDFLIRLENFPTEPIHNTGPGRLSRLLDLMGKPSNQ